jgi:hypothetical protein
VTASRPTRCARITDVFFTRTPRSTRAGIRLSCGHFQTMTLEAFNRRPWRVGQTRDCLRPHLIVETRNQALARKAARR